MRTTTMIILVIGLSALIASVLSSSKAIFSAGLVIVTIGVFFLATDRKGTKR